MVDSYVQRESRAVFAVFVPGIWEKLTGSCSVQLFVPLALVSACEALGIKATDNSSADFKT